MKIHLKAKPVIAVIDERDGQYPRITIVVEESPATGKYADNMAFEFRKTDMVSNVAVGDIVNIGGYLRSRETNGRWFTNVNGALCEMVARGADKPAPADDPIPF